MTPAELPCARERLGLFGQILQLQQKGFCRRRRPREGLLVFIIIVGHVEQGPLGASAARGQWLPWTTTAK
jgi:hypothetical protein